MLSFTACGSDDDDNENINILDNIPDPGLKKHITENLFNDKLFITPKDAVIIVRIDMTN